MNLNVNKLRGVIAARGVTQGELARMIGVNENTLSYKLRGMRPFNTDELERIREALQIPTREYIEIFLPEALHKWNGGV